MDYSSYELKYCERCGGLGLRRSKSGLPYSRSCEEMLQNFLIRPGQPHSTGHRQGRRALRRAAPVASAVSAHAAQELRYAF